MIPHSGTTKKVSNHFWKNWTSVVLAPEAVPGQVLAEAVEEALPPEPPSSSPRSFPPATAYNLHRKDP